ncbi:MAG: hypothetical protein ACYSUA_17665, partial [Planctomycetota bacterium]
PHRDCVRVSVHERAQFDTGATPLVKPRFRASLSASLVIRGIAPAQRLGLSGPEGLLAIPQRDLSVVPSEVDLAARGIHSAISIFDLDRPDAHPGVPGSLAGEDRIDKIDDGRHAARAGSSSGGRVGTFTCETRLPGLGPVAD